MGEGDGADWEVSRRKQMETNKLEGGREGGKRVLPGARNG